MITDSLSPITIINHNETSAINEYISLYNLSRHFGTKKKEKKNGKLEKETIAVFHPFFELYFLGQIIEPRPYWSFPI